jgi:hypothetical protein
MKSVILKNFDLGELRRKRARQAATGGVDLVSAIDTISPDIGKLKVGETVQLTLPGKNADERKNGLRKFVMSITAKLNNLTPRGGAWEGRVFDVASDGEEFVYVQRGPDLKGDAIPQRKRRGGGRKPATPAQAGETVAAGGSAEVAGGATVTERPAA